MSLEHSLPSLANTQHVSRDRLGQGDSRARMNMGVYAPLRPRFCSPIIQNRDGECEHDVESQDHSSEAKAEDVARYV